MVFTSSGQRRPEKGQHGKEHQHGGNDETVRTENNQADKRKQKPKNRTGMALFFHPLFHKDYHKHGCHDKIQSLCTEVNQRTEDASQSGAGYPVNVIIQGYKKHEPASIHIFRDFCGIVYGKTFIAHTEDQIEFFQTGSLVFFQHGNTVKKMTGVNHQSHGQCLNRMEGAQKKIYGNKFNESGKNCQAHEHGIPEAES